MKRLLTLITLGGMLSVSLLAVGDQSVDPALRKVVETYWNAVDARDWSTTYKLEKATQDASAPLDPMVYFRRMEKTPRYRSITVDEITQDGEAGASTVSVTIVLPLGTAAFDIPRRFQATWEQVGDQWYHVDTEAIPFERASESSGDAATSGEEAEKEASPASGSD